MWSLGIRQNSAWIAVAALGCVLAVWLIAVQAFNAPRAQFSAAANSLGLTTEHRLKLRRDFEQALLAMERNRCSEAHRLVAGEAAVAYYETLLEKPFIAAKLSMTNRSVCSRGTTDEPLNLIEAFQNGLRLPWDCMPEDWRTPADLALQAKLEAEIRDRGLTAEALTGTLGLLSRSWDQSAHAVECGGAKPERSPRSSSSSRRLPLLAAPIDPWSGSRRRH